MWLRGDERKVTAREVNVRCESARMVSRCRRKVGRSELERDGEGGNEAFICWERANGRRSSQCWALCFQTTAEKREGDGSETGQVAATRRQSFRSNDVVCDFGSDW